MLQGYGSVCKSAAKEHVKGQEPGIRCHDWVPLLPQPKEILASAGSEQNSIFTSAIYYDRVHLGNPVTAGYILMDSFNTASRYLSWIR